jgi:hypothetical protein
MDRARPSSKAADRGPRPQHPQHRTTHEEPTVSPKVRTDDSDEDRKRRTDATQNAIRAKAARAVRIVFGVLAAILALGALLVVLRDDINENNEVVKLITDIADAISGPFSRNDGIFDFTGKNAEAKNALLNWGIAAVVYLLIGRFLANAIAPKSSR